MRRRRPQRRQRWSSSALVDWQYRHSIKIPHSQKHLSRSQGACSETATAYSKMLRLRTSKHPCYGSGLKPRYIASASKAFRPNLAHEVTFLRNIFGRKCHELCWAPAALLTVFLLASPLLTVSVMQAQQPPPPTPSAPPPPTPAPAPNAANPNQKLSVRRPGAPGPDEY